MAVTGLTPNFCTQKATQGALIGTNLSLPLFGFLLYPIFWGGTWCLPFLGGDSAYYCSPPATQGPVGLKLSK